MQTADRPARKDIGRWMWLRIFLFILSAITLLLSDPSVMSSQSATPATPPAQTVTPSSPPQSDKTSEEITSREEKPTFKVNVNLVLVRVVVRDHDGQAIGNLSKDDFQLFDNRKLQSISQFSAEQLGAKPAGKAEVHEKSEAGETQPESGKLEVPENYFAYLFDDVHLTFGDLAQARNAAERHLAAMRPTERAAIFTTSGQTTLDFTDDRASLHDALLHLHPRPISSGGTAGCFDLTYYMADMIENKHDSQALQVATQDALICEFNGDPTFRPAAQQMAESMAVQKLSEGQAESHVALTVLNDVIHRMSVVPGRRNIVMVSPGFLTPEMESEYTALIDRAVRSQVTIGGLDARGLYIVPAGGDIASRQSPDPVVVGMKQLYATSEASADADILSVLAEATGGIFYQNSNDLDEGFRRTASTPEYSYVLGFSPQNLKLDGSFHSIKVTVKSPQKATVQARRGYFAPKHAADPAQEAKQEIEDALFSQEEVHNLPVELHTQFFKSTEIDAKLTVLAHIDVRRLKLRKADGRNREELTVVSALFNRNGSFLQAIEKTITMRLKDETLEKKMGSGITLRTSFDVKPGSYLVRLVVRDAEAQLVSAESDAVRIP